VLAWKLALLVWNVRLSLSILPGNGEDEGDRS
jgi:hypothetical protein